MEQAVVQGGALMPRGVSRRLLPRPQWQLFVSPQFTAENLLFGNLQNHANFSPAEKS